MNEYKGKDGKTRNAEERPEERHDGRVNRDNQSGSKNRGPRGGKPRRDNSESRHDERPRRDKYGNHDDRPERGYSKGRKSRTPLEDMPERRDDRQNRSPRDEHRHRDDRANRGHSGEHYTGKETDSSQDNKHRRGYDNRESVPGSIGESKSGERGPRGGKPRRDNSESRHDEHTRRDKYGNHDDRQNRSPRDEHRHRDDRVNRGGSKNSAPSGGDCRPYSAGSGNRDDRERNDIIFGRNPVAEALKSGRPVERLLLQNGSVNGPSGRIFSMAREKGIPVETVEKRALDRVSGGGAHQGVIAFVSAHAYADIEDCFRLAEERGEPPFFVVLDGIEDPGNLGAIIRTAECAGAHGVIIPKRRAAGLTETVAKASAGAVEYMPCVRVSNLPALLEGLKSRGLWIIAADMDGGDYTKVDYKVPCAVVIGSEGGGISRLVKEKCDFTVSLPVKGHINSLNASNAAAVLMYEIRRDRDSDA